MEELGVSQTDLDRLNDTEKRDISNFAQAESQRLQVQQSIHEFSETCFKKCIRGSMGSSGGRLTSKESTCMSNCVNRFMDSNLAILKHLEMMRASQ